MQGQALALSVLLYMDKWPNRVMYVPIIALVFMAGTAETARDTRSVVYLAWVSAACLELGGVAADADAVQAFLSSVAVLAVFRLGHRTKHYARRRRDMEHWAHAIAFIKFGEVKRRREVDRGFVLVRRQDMDPKLFGDPAHAKYIIAVSHAWLSPNHADPDGLHLDIMLLRLEEVLEAEPSSYLFHKWWWRYYYLESEGDVVFFFDMSSLPQTPRTPQEESDFKQALGFMHFLYHSFNVLAITEIPDSHQQDEPRLAYLDRGWCWAEAEVASIGNKLGFYSRGLIKELAKETQQRTSCGISRREALWGVPGYPPELMKRGNEHLLIEFRNNQVIKGKIFSNGRFDADQVARILVTIEGKQKLRQHLEAGDYSEVMNIFDDSEFFTAEQSDMTRKDLANTVFDGVFTTPLHLAVQADAPKLVEFLIEMGARPHRNFFGYMPWERRWFIPRFSAAARAARTLPDSEAEAMQPTASWYERVSWSARRVSSVRMPSPGAHRRTQTMPSGLFSL